MRGLRKKFEKFCYLHRYSGIPNLMLYLTIGTAIVYVMSTMDRSMTLYYALCFDRNLILQGQVWRLITFAFTYNAGNLILTAITLLCYFSLGRAMENAWGTLKFNLFYLTGIVMMDAFGMIFGVPVDVTYLNLSLFLSYATLYPDSQFLLFFIIPVRAWIFALFDLALTLIDVVSFTMRGVPFPVNLYPLVAIANYLLFFGKDVTRVIPISWKVNARKNFGPKPKAAKKSGTIPFPSAGSYQATNTAPQAPYTHKCTVCGRTDVTNPELEFRYCSKCRGYHCYCEDHINNHEHIQ